MDRADVLNGCRLVGRHQLLVHFGDGDGRDDENDRDDDQQFDEREATTAAIAGANGCAHIYILNALGSVDTLGILDDPQAPGVQMGFLARRFGNVRQILQDRQAVLPCRAHLDEIRVIQMQLAYDLADLVILSQRYVVLGRGHCEKTIE